MKKRAGQQKMVGPFGLLKINVSRVPVPTDTPTASPSANTPSHDQSPDPAHKPSEYQLPAAPSQVPDIMHRHRLVITAGRHIKIDSAFAVMDIVDRQLGIVHFIRPICLAIREGVQ